MQSKGKLGSIVAGVIAIFLFLICLFYLSFTFVGNKYEKEADQYALTQVQQEKNKVAKEYPDSVYDENDRYNVHYKNYMDKYGEEKVYLGYTLNEVRQWGVNLGLDLKGGMNVTLQVDLGEMLTSLTDNPTDNFKKAVENTNKNSKSKDNYFSTFIEEYKKLDSGVDFKSVFNKVNISSNSDGAVEKALRDEVKNIVENSAVNVLRNRIDQFGVVSPNIQVLEDKDGQILLELPGVKDHQRVRDLLQRQANLEFYEAYTAKQDKDEVAPLIADLKDAVRAERGEEAAAQLEANLATANRFSAIMGFAASTEAMDQIDHLLTPEVLKALPEDLRLAWGNKPEVLTDKDGKETKLGYALYALRLHDGNPVLDGSVVTDAYADLNTQKIGGGAENYVSMRMNSEGAAAWARITKDNLGRPIAIVLDGRVYSAPNVQSVIDGGQSQITGNFSVDEAKDLANVLKSGKMNAKVSIISDMVVGPALGEQAIKAGFISFVVALVLLMIFMIVFYGFIPGLTANVCLILNLFFTLGILASFQAVLTMSGICGIVLSLGMAVDANVLIFERAKEELRAGKNSRTAIADGYSNAFSAIFDSNLTSIITGIILLLFGTGPIKGFATTLIIGIVCSFFTAVYLSRLVFIWGAKKKAFEKLTFSTPISRKMFVNSHINFLGQRKFSFSVVGLFVVIVIASLFMRGLNQGIDFSGGRNYVVKFEKDVDPVKIQAKLKDVFQKGYEKDGHKYEGDSKANVQVITIESGNQVRISTNYMIDTEGEEIEKDINQMLYDNLVDELNNKDGHIDVKAFSSQDSSVGVVSSVKVGPTVADDMRTEAYIAVSLALLAMFLYILLRFRNVAFSLGALAAVAFTAFSIIGFYSLFWGVFPFAMEIDQTFIAAILTVIGYQINDTVVVFDRVRENVGLFPKQDFFTTVNRSINSTLGRTIMTSCSTLLVLLCIFILGGDAIRSFTFAMIFGVVIGTAATIYIAAPVAYLTDRRRGGRIVKKAAAAAEQPKK